LSRSATRPRFSSVSRATKEVLAEVPTRPSPHPIGQPNAPRLLDVNGAAAHLGVSPRFIRRLVAERRIAFIKLGRHLRFDLAELERFINDGRVDAAPWF
jgi:excisionase family DNA binding protein